MARTRRLFLILAMGAALAGCGGAKHAARQPPAPPPGCTAATAPAAHARSAPKPTERLDPAKTYDVTFTTNCGSFTIRLAVKTSPNTTASFVSLVRRGFYDKTVFHRIVPGFVIQGGDPTATGMGGPGYTVVDKPPSTTKYVHGLAAMAKTASQPAGTSGSQFFVMTKGSSLPADYAVLGMVVRGLPVVDRIGKLGDADGNPTAVVEIERATVSEH